MFLGRKQSRTGFTLIELILVLAVIAFIVGMVAPSLRGFSAGARLRDTADHYLALTRLARLQAISTGQVHRLTIDASQQRCVVAAEVGQQLNELGTSDGAFEIPDGVSIQLKDQQGQARDYVQFYPNGRTQAAKVRFSQGDGEQFLDVECVAPTEGFYLVPAGGAK